MRRGLVCGALIALGVSCGPRLLSHGPAGRGVSRLLEGTLVDVAPRTLAVESPGGGRLPLHRSEATLVLDHGLPRPLQAFPRGAKVRVRYRLQGDQRWAEAVFLLTVPPEDPVWQNTTNTDQPNSRVNSARHELMGTFREGRP